MVVLALDLGTTTGWATYKNIGGYMHGSKSFKPSRYEGGGVRFLQFSAWVRSIIDQCEPNVIVYEEVRRHMSTDAAHVYGGFLAVLTSFCEELGLPYDAIPVGTIKKHITGKGNASKEEVIKAVKKKLQQEPEDDNAADALAILDCYRNRYTN